MNQLPTIEQADVQGKRVLVRVDFNVPLADGQVTDDTRLEASLPTIRHLIDAGAHVILASHLGRPQGSRDPDLSLRPVAQRLGQLLDHGVAFAEDCVGDVVATQVAALGDSDILLLENLRFHKGEKANDAEFARQLASLADVYVNDAFGAAHRAHASTVGVTDHLPAFAGKLLTKELEVIGGLLKDPAKPFVAVLGGAKVSGKVDVIRNLMDTCDAILVGGAMAFTFSAARGGRTGASLVEKDRVDMARDILGEAEERGVDLRLPKDVVVTKDLKGNGEPHPVNFMEVDEGWKGVDIGQKTVHDYAEVVAKAKTVLFNGPMGVFEVDPFHLGTCGVLRAMASNDKATTVLGGGDSAAAAARCEMTEHMTHISTGGGAALELLEGKTLPAIAALTGKARPVSA